MSQGVHFANSTHPKEEVPPTEVGGIPEAWHVHELADFGVVRSGSGFPLIFQGKQSGDYPFFKVSDMNNTGNELFMKSANHWVSKATMKKLGASSFDPGSIVFAKIGAAIFLERRRLLSQQSCLDNNMMAFTMVDRHACQRFFYYLLVRTELGKLVSATALPSLSGRQVGALSFPVPPSQEQRAIAEALSDVDDLLAALEALIAKKQAIKQGAMQQLLPGKTRLPGFTGEWKSSKLGDCRMFLSGSGFPLVFQGYLSGQYPFFKVSDLSNKGNEIYMKSANNWVSEEVRRSLGAIAVPTGSTVFAKIGAAILLERKRLLSQESCLDNNMMAFSLVDHLSCPEFFYYLFCGIELAKFVATTALPALAGRHIGAITVQVPPLPEQCAIASVLGDMDSEIALLESRGEKTRAIKQGMMQELLTG